MSDSRKSKVLSLSLAQGILTLVNVAVGMVFARVLTVSDYGTYMQTFLAYDFAVPILTLGLPNALYYFLPGAEDERKTVMEILLLLLLAGVVFSVFLLCGGVLLLAERFNNQELVKTVQWMWAYPMYTFPILIISTVLVVKDKVNINAVYNVVTGLILTIALIVAVFIGRSYELPVLIRIYLPLFFFPMALYLIFKNTSGGWAHPQISSMWRMLKFSVPLGLASIFITLTLQFANIVVSALCSPEDYAIFTLGARELPVIGIITGSMATIVMADMSQKIKEGNMQEALNLFRKSALMGALLLFPIMFFLLLYAKEFIVVLFSEKYLDSVIPFGVFLLYLPIRIVFYQSAFIALGKSKIILYRAILSFILTVALCLIFTKLWGMMGTAIGVVFVAYVWDIPYNLITIGKSFNCPFYRLLPLNEISKIAIVSIVATMITLPVFCLACDDLLKISIAGALFVLVYCGIAFRKIEMFRMLSQLIIDKIKIKSYYNDKKNS